MELLELIQTLNAAHGPSGDEGGIRERLAELARPLADEISTDTMGNLIVRKLGSGPRVMLCAHMDSIGFIVTHVEENGFLRVGRLGGISPKEAAYTPVRFAGGARGVIVPEEKADFGKLKLDECYVDIGAKDRETALKAVAVGDTMIYDSPCFTNQGKVVSPYLDNRISCAILLKVLEEMELCPNDLYVVFTVQEEVGLRGAKPAAWAVDPDYAVVVDVTDVDDTPGSEKCGTVRLGKGPAIKIMDSSVICHPDMIQKLESQAKTLDMPTQRDIMRAGGTDAGVMHTTRIGVRTGGVSVPCRYIHTPVEMADLQDARDCAKLLCAFVQSKLESL
ncbi:M42 family metallopeptidase [Flintibacter faecis]|uniref:M42 family metallopeptidase n=1 Tax=Flintibacter faecis TaxID=2763047 RepID=A0A8J6M435_9FIRM|nr:M42 family metallopeptidase [Flintibacter faecis]MBC5717228.1 M42 family metallopeptidase [Flintibacter faecis]